MSVELFRQVLGEGVGKLGEFWGSLEIYWEHIFYFVVKLPIRCLLNFSVEYLGS